MSLNVLTQGGGTGGASASIFVTGLSEADTVTATKGGKTVQGKWVERKNPECVVPDGYTQLEYIQSTGTQYIDTGWKPAKGDTLTIESSLSSDVNESGFAGYTSQWELYYDVNRNVLAWSSGTTITALQIENHPVPLNQKNTVQVRFDSAQSTGTGYLFTYRPGDYPFNGRIYSAVVKNSAGTILRNFYPAKRNSDGVVGLYDLKNSKFYTNAGSGKFGAGKEISALIGGFLIEPIKKYGVWAVTATNGEKTDTQDVLVDAAVEFKIELYLNRLYLYKYGDECEEITGGWASPSLHATDYVYDHCRNQYSFIERTKNDDNLFLDCRTLSTSQSGVSVASFWEKKAIDLTNYSTLKVKMDLLSINTNVYVNARSPLTNTVYVEDREWAKYITNTTVGESIVILDVSSLKGSYYVGIGVAAYDKSIQRKASNTYEIWLE